jgi:hypothetical protein
MLGFEREKKLSENLIHPKNFIKKKLMIKVY